MIAVTAVGANPIYDQDDGLIRTAVDGHLEIRAGSNGQWAGVRLVGHRERPTSALDDNDSWEQSEEAVVTFHGSPVILVGSSTSFGIEPAMRNLDISEGTYGVMVRAKGIAESFTHSPEPTVPVESAPPTEELVQQIRIDMWPAPYPYDLNYDPSRPPRPDTSAAPAGGQGSNLRAPLSARRNVCNGFRMLSSMSCQIQWFFMALIAASSSPVW